MGARSGGGGGAGMGGGSGSLTSIAKSAQRIFHSKAVSNYFNGSNNPKDVAAYDKYKQQESKFKAAWKAKYGAKSEPAFGDWSGAILDYAFGNVG